MHRNKKIELFVIAGALVFLAGIIIFSSGSGRITSFAVADSDVGLIERFQNAFSETFGDSDEIPKFDYSKFEGREDVYAEKGFDFVGPEINFLSEEELSFNELEDSPDLEFSFASDYSLDLSDFSEGNSFDNELLVSNAELTFLASRVSDVPGAASEDYGPGVMVVLSEPPAVSVVLERNVGREIDNCVSTKKAVALTGSRALTSSELKSCLSEPLVKDAIYSQVNVVSQQQADFIDLLETTLGHEVDYKGYGDASNTIFISSLNYDSEVDSFLKSLTNDVVGVYPNRKYALSLATSVPYIGAPEVWDLYDPVGQSFLDGTGTSVAVIDTGVDYTHPDFGFCDFHDFSMGNCEKFGGGWSFVSGGPDPFDEHGHGTHVAATIGGVDDVYRGVAPGAKLFIYEVCDVGGSCYQDAIIGGVNYAIDPNRDGDYSDHVDVISMSLGGSGTPQDELSQAIDNATSLGIISAVAAGNSGPSPETVECPACAETAIAVAAVCQPHQHISCGGNIAPFSSRGPYRYGNLLENNDKPEIAAPGVGICAALARGSALQSYTACGGEDGVERVSISGTSMATPHTSGLLALMRQADPDLSPEDAQELLKQTALDLGNPPEMQGAGLIQASEAVGVLTNFQSNLRLRPSFKTISFSEDNLTRYLNGQYTINFSNFGEETFPVEITVNQDYPNSSLILDNSQFSLQPGQTVVVSFNYSLDILDTQTNKFTYRLNVTTPGQNYSVKHLFTIPSYFSVSPFSFGLIAPQESGDFSEDVNSTITLKNNLLDQSQVFTAEVLSGLDYGPQYEPFQSYRCEGSFFTGEALFDNPLIVPPNGTITLPIRITLNGLNYLEKGIILCYGTFQITSSLQDKQKGIYFQALQHPLLTVYTNDSSYSLGGRYILTDLSPRYGSNYPTEWRRYDGYGPPSYSSFGKKQWANVYPTLYWIPPYHSPPNYDVAFSHPWIGIFTPSSIFITPSEDMNIYFQSSVNFSSNWHQKIYLNDTLLPNSYRISLDEEFSDELFREGTNFNYLFMLLLDFFKPTDDQENPGIVSFPLNPNALDASNPYAPFLTDITWHYQDFGALDVSLKSFGFFMNVDSPNPEDFWFYSHLLKNSSDHSEYLLRQSDLGQFNVTQYVEVGEAYDSLFDQEPAHYLTDAYAVYLNWCSGSPKSSVFPQLGNAESVCKTKSFDITENRILNEYIDGGRFSGRGFYTTGINYFPPNYDLQEGSGAHKYFPGFFFYTSPVGSWGGTHDSQSLVYIPESDGHVTSYYYTPGQTFQFIPPGSVYDSSDYIIKSDSYLHPFDYSPENFSRNALYREFSSPNVNLGFFPIYFTGQIGVSTNASGTNLFAMPFNSYNYWSTQTRDVVFRDYSNLDLIPNPQNHREKYLLYRDGILIRSGIYMANNDLLPTIFLPTAPGFYSINMNMTRYMGGRPLLSKAQMQYNHTSCSEEISLVNGGLCGDINPPALTLLNIYSGSEQIAYISALEETHVVGEIVPGKTCYRNADNPFYASPVCVFDDRITDISLRYRPIYSDDSAGEYASLALSTTGNFDEKVSFEAVVPYAGARFTEIEISAVDSFGNRILETIQVLSGNECGNNLLEDGEDCDCGLDGICLPIELSPFSCSDYLGGISLGQISSCTSSCEYDLSDCITECSDGFDNDNDGLVDFPDDSDCTDLFDNTEDVGAANCLGEDLDLNDGTCLATFSIYNAGQLEGKYEFKYVSSSLDWDQIRSAESSTDSVNRDFEKFALQNNYGGEVSTYPDLLSRIGLLYDTSRLSSENTLISAVLEFQPLDDGGITQNYLESMPSGYMNHFVSVYPFFPDDFLSISREDYNNFGTSELADFVSREYTADNLNLNNPDLAIFNRDVVPTAFNLNSQGLQSISIDGITGFGLRFGQDVYGLEGYASAGSSLALGWSPVLKIRYFSENPICTPGQQAIECPLQVGVCSEVTRSCSDNGLFNLCDYGSDYQAVSEIYPVNRCNDGLDNDCDSLADILDSDCTCGNNYADSGEFCDGADLNDRTCSSFGYAGGEVSCLDSCQGFDLRGCVGGEGSLCGNAFIEAGEQCDDGNIVTESCAYGLQSCTVCSSQCSLVSGETSFCGDGLSDSSFEQCDGSDLLGLTCRDFDFDLGTISCGLDCTFNLSQCRLFECSDGLDNDGDGLTDYPAESECLSSEDDKESYDCLIGHNNTSGGLCSLKISPFFMKSLNANNYYSTSGDLVSLFNAQRSKLVAQTISDSLTVSSSLGRYGSNSFADVSRPFLVFNLTDQLPEDVVVTGARFSFTRSILNQLPPSTYTKGYLTLVEVNVLGLPIPYSSFYNYFGNYTLEEVVLPSERHSIFQPSQPIEINIADSYFYNLQQKELLILGLKTGLDFEGAGQEEASLVSGSNPLNSLVVAASLGSPQLEILYRPSTLCGNDVVDAGEQCDDGNLAGGDGCDHLCRVEVVCDLSNSEWNVESATEGDLLTLSVEGESCFGQTVNFEVFENDLIGDDTVDVQPQLTVFSGDTATTTWTAEFDSEDFGANSEYYFVASLASDETVSATSGDLIVSPLPVQPVCGNNVVESGEQCDDGNNLNGDGCSSTCQIEAQPVCGNNLIEGEEICDGTDLDEQTCSSVSPELPEGVLGCLTDCSGFDVSQCSPGSVGICGNNIVEGSEVCDGTDLAFASCTDFGFVSGSLNCNLQCSGYDTSQCIGVVEPVCGNSLCENGESYQTCAVDCPIKPVCGDGVIGVGEVCDDSNRISGDGCSSTCKLEPAQGPRCGDGVVNGNEACDDGNNLNGDGCSSTCSHEFTPRIGCGNSIIEAGESCDDGNIVTESCAYGLQSCTVCSSQCQNVAGATKFCGDGSIQTQNGEICDLNNLNGNSCLGLGYEGGSLICGNSCNTWNSLGCAVNLDCQWDADRNNLVEEADRQFVAQRYNCLVGVGNLDCDSSDVNEDGRVNPVDRSLISPNLGHVCPGGQQPSTCGDNVDNGDGTCTANLDNPILDGHVSFNGNAYNQNSNEAYLRFAYSYEEIFRSFIEWDISSIPSGATINEVSLKYHGGPSTLVSGKANRVLTSPASLTSSGSFSSLYSSLVNSGTYYSSNFPVQGPNKLANLGLTAVNDLQSRLNSGQNWFAVGLQSNDELVQLLNSPTLIYSEEAVGTASPPRPTLVVKYTA